MIDGKRQKPCRKKRVEEVIDDPYNDAWKVNFERNQTMIDMTKIPDEYESLILEEFEKDMVVNDRSKLLDYFIKNKMILLMDELSEFKEANYEVSI